MPLIVEKVNTLDKSQVRRFVAIPYRLYRRSIAGNATHAMDGVGILPEFHGLGGDALLYAEMEDTLRSCRFAHADLTQVAESAVQMRHDLENAGGKMYENHRVYRKVI